MVWERVAGGTKRSSLNSNIKRRHTGGGSRDRSLRRNRGAYKGRKAEARVSLVEDVKCKMKGFHRSISTKERIGKM